MWRYEKRLQYPVRIKNPDARAAKIIITQFGGPDGELAASMRYLSQRYAMPYRNIAGVLTDIGTEELAHMEMVCAMVHQLTRDLTIEQIKAAVLADIDRQTDEKILKECPWTVLHGSDAGKQVTLWLSAENQRNYSEGQRVAMITEGASLPMKFKVGQNENVTIDNLCIKYVGRHGVSAGGNAMKFKVEQNEDGTAVYDIFETVDEITRFYISGVNFINQTLNEGWARKDSIDWTPYEAYFPQNDNNSQE